MARVMRPGGRLLLVVWGQAGRVWWSPAIELIETRAEYYSGVCPMIFFYGLPGVLARMLADAGLEVEREETLAESMRFGSVEEAVEATTIGGPLQGLFVHRLSDEARDEVRRGPPRAHRAAGRAGRRRGGAAERGRRGHRGQARGLSREWTGRARSG